MSDERALGSTVSGYPKMSPFAIDGCNFEPDVLSDGGQIVVTAAKMAIYQIMSNCIFSRIVTESLSAQADAVPPAGFANANRMRIALPAAEG